MSILAINKEINDSINAVSKQLAPHLDNESLPVLLNLAKQNSNNTIGKLVKGIIQQLSPSSFISDVCQFKFDLVTSKFKCADTGLVFFAETDIEAAVTTGVDTWKFDSIATLRIFDVDGDNVFVDLSNYQIVDASDIQLKLLENKAKVFESNMGEHSIYDHN